MLFAEKLADFRFHATQFFDVSRFCEVEFVRFLRELRAESSNAIADTLNGVAEDSVPYRAR